MGGTKELERYPVTASDRGSSKCNPKCNPKRSPMPNRWLSLMPSPCVDSSLRTGAWHVTTFASISGCTHIYRLVQLLTYNWYLIYSMTVFFLSLIYFRKISSNKVLDQKTPSHGGFRSMWYPVYTPSLAVETYTLGLRRWRGYYWVSYRVLLPKGKPTPLNSIFGSGDGTIESVTKCCCLRVGLSGTPWSAQPPVLLGPASLCMEAWRSKISGLLCSVYCP